MAGLVQVQREPPVSLGQVYPSRDMAPFLPCAQGVVPRRPGLREVRKLSRLQPPPGRGQYRAPVPQARQERHRPRHPPVEQRHSRALGTAEFGQEPGERRGMGIQVQRVHAHGLHPDATRWRGQVHPAAVTAHRQVLHGQEMIARSAVLFQADHSR